MIDYSRDMIKDCKNFTWRLGLSVNTTIFLDPLMVFL